MTVSRRKVGLYLLGIASFVVSSCASEVSRSPRIDLARYGTIGMIEFSSNAAHELGPLASQKFVAAVQSAQPGVPILELGDESRVLRSVQRHELDPETIHEIGKKYRVDAIVAGDLDTRGVKPEFSVDSTRHSMSASAYIEGSLSAKIFEARSGATIWTNAARGKETVAHVDLSTSHLPRVGAKNRDDAHGRLVHALVSRVTADFWPHYEKR
jgi:hypothetical protein